MADDEVYGGMTALQNEVEMLYPTRKPISEQVIIHQGLNEVDVQKLIDKSLQEWQPHQLQFKKLIDDALRVAFKERSLTSEGISEARSKKVERDTMIKMQKQIGYKMHQKVIMLLH